MMKIVYPVHSGLYFNLTNRCPCACTFCIRQKASGAEFENVETLWLDHEPTAQEVIDAIKEESKLERFKNYKEFVFCGYGEPTEALDVLLETARFLKEKTDKPIRINTNGLGNLINKKDITPLFEGLIDAVSTSLNSSDPKIYAERVRPKFGEESHSAMLDFARCAVKHVPNVTMTTVSTTITKEDEENCRKICESLGVKYRIRELI